MNESFLFALGDGDRVREKIDNELLGGNLDEVRILSQKLTYAMQTLSEIADQNPGWQIVFSGGDDICIVIERPRYHEEIIFSLMQRFQDLTGGTMSFGIGTSMGNAYLNLRRAKARGGNILVTDPELTRVART
jgi:minimal CRISPR polymerase-like protein